MLNILTILASALVSGLVASWLTLVYTARNERRRAKLSLFQQLVGTRNVLLPGPHDPNAEVLFISAVNQLFLLFHDAPGVLVALKSFHEMISDPNASPDIRNQRLLELFKSMAQHLHVNTEPLGEGFFMRAFSVNSVIGPQALDLGVKGIRLQDGRPVLFGIQDLGSGQRLPFFIPAELSIQIGAALIELALIARERDASLRATGFVDLSDLSQRIARRVGEVG